MGVRQGGSRSGRTKKQLMDLRGGMPYTYMLENFFPDLRSSLSVVCYRKPEPPVKSFPKKSRK